MMSKKFPGANDLYVFPVLRKMALVARNQVVGSDGISAFNKNIASGSGAFE
jgi:hypothetical protein